MRAEPCILQLSTQPIKMKKTMQPPQANHNFPYLDCTVSTTTLIHRGNVIYKEPDHTSAQDNSTEVSDSTQNYSEENNCTDGSNTEKGNNNYTDNSSNTEDIIYSTDNTEDNNLSTVNSTDTENNDSTDNSDINNSAGNSDTEVNISTDNTEDNNSAGNTNLKGNNSILQTAIFSGGRQIYANMDLEILWVEILSLNARLNAKNVNCIAQEK